MSYSEQDSHIKVVLDFLLLHYTTTKNETMLQVLIHLV